MTFIIELPGTQAAGGACVVLTRHTTTRDGKDVLFRTSANKPWQDGECLGFVLAHSLGVVQRRRGLGRGVDPKLVSSPVK